ncbi:MAG: Ig-like domain-containing protein [Oscillospiraceae bacterium]|nr:Ig-like domain-containing protein [Oscillospiraceae bacterium]
MKKRLISLFTALTVAAFALPTVTMAAEVKTPKYQQTARQMEKLNRGLIAVRTQDAPRNGIAGGVYLSWRLLGDESLSNQAFDIYRDGAKIHTTGPHDATNYLDTGGNENNVYKVVKAGATSAQVSAEPGVKAFREWNHTARGSMVGNGSEANSFSWVDIPLVRPADVKNHGGGWSHYHTDGSNEAGGANDASVGDLDGDGDYELVLKWNPSDAKDSASGGYTGNVYIDAYEISEDNGGYMWRIDLGKNIRAGAHYTQFMVYDFDGDGKAEVAMKTAPGSIDGTGHYVTEVGDSDAIRNADNNAVHLSGKGIPTSGGEFLTIFDGETGRALYTTDYISRDAGGWGDSNYNRSERYLAAVAYLNGETPSLIMCRGYYNRAMVRAYDWDGEKLTMLWEHNGDAQRSNSLYGQGNHNLSVADVDNDGRDEIVYGSAVLDDNGWAIGNTYLGHGDAMHVSDFNNDGIQEVFSVKEKSGSSINARREDFRVASTGEKIYSVSSSGDNGRGLMVNADDSYAATHPDGLALGWSAVFGEAHDMTGKNVGERPGTNSRMMTNFAVYWDGDLGRELLDDNQLAKYHTDGTKNAEGKWNSWTGRFYNDGQGYLPASSINDSKQNPSLSVDLWGDWREEIIMPINNGENDTPYLRIFTSTLPTEYRLTTLMHDSQYRTAIAWQNVAYNQPPHPSYYIGSVALATDANGNKLNYLAPAVPFTRVRYAETIPVESITLTEKSVTVRENDTYQLKATIYPENASTQSIIWTSSDESVAKVAGGVITGIAPGTATITATTRDGGHSAECKVTVIRINVDSISLSEDNIAVKEGGSHWLTATIYPEDATRKDITWMSSDDRIATVDGGRVTGVSAGSCTITATTALGGHFAICRVTVLPVDDIDVLDDGVFDGMGGSGTVVTGDKTSASLNQEGAPQGGEFYRDFIPFFKDTATISFTFNTGGKKIDGTNWNWDGHEYTFGLEFLDIFGNNILNLSQAYRSGAQSTMAAENNAWEEAIKDSWTQVGNGSENPMNRSSTTWLVTLEFNYDEDSCTATIMGGNNDIGYTKTFSLEGKSFKRLRYYTTVDGSGPISVGPYLTNLSYTLSTADKDVSLDILNVNGQTAEARIIGGKAGVSRALLVGELYDKDGNVVETEEWAVELPTVQKTGFDKNIGDYDLKLSLWDGDTLLAESSLSAISRPNIGAVTATAEPQPENSIKNAYDGDLNTVWAAEGTQSITFELEKDHILTGVRVAFKKYNDARIIPFRIYASDDGENWSLVYIGTNVPFSGDFIDCAVMPLETSRYVKVECDGSDWSSWTSLAEVEIYASGITEEEPEEEKRPEGLKIVSASATAEPEKDNSAKNAYDGNINTVWTAEGTQSITFDLGKAYTLTDVSVAFKKYDDDRTIPFRVYVSNGAEETKVYDGSSAPNSGGFNDIEISPNLEGRYVRVECDGNTVSYWTSLAEVLIYGFEIPGETVPEYTVEYDFNGGEGTVPDEHKASVPKGGTITLWQPKSEDAPKREGAVFLGWSTEKHDIFSTAPADSVFIQSVVSAEGVKVYAVWAADKNGSSVPDYYEYAIHEVSVSGASAEVTLYGKDGALLIGALYSSEGVLDEVRFADVTLPAKAKLTFDKNIDGYELRIFLWTSKDGLVPLAAPYVSKNK